jgi:hypothetical protein
MIAFWGIRLALTGAALLLVGAMPIRLPIVGRAALAVLGFLALGFGILLPLVADPSLPPSADELVPYAVALLTIALVGGQRLVWRLHRNRREWYASWNQQIHNPLFRGVFKRYHDLD